MHQLARVAGVGLQQQRLLMAAATQAGAVVEHALAAAAGHVLLGVAGGGLAEGLVMGRHIAFLGTGDGEYQPLVLLEQRLLDIRQDLVGVTVEARAVLLRIGARHHLEAAVEEVIEADASFPHIALEALGDFARALPGQVVDALVVVIQPHLRQPFADGFRLPFQLAGGGSQAAGLFVAHTEVTAHLPHRLEQPGELVAVGAGATGDLVHLPFHRCGQPGDLLQLAAGQLHLADARLQVRGELLDLLHHQCRLALDIGHHLPHFAGGAGRAAGQPAHLVRHHGKATAVLPRPRGLDGGIQRQQVGLAGDGLDDLGHLLDFLAALAEGGDQLAAGAGPEAQLLHEGDGLLQHLTPFIAALARVVGGGKGLLAEFGGGGLGGDHHLGAADDAFGSLQLGLEALGQAVHRPGDPGGGQGVVAGTARQVAGEPGDVGALLHGRLLRWRLPEQPGQRQQEQPPQPGRQPGQGQASGNQEDQ
ncbi:hypothetical protein FQZ97_539190 [compost metagenome]